VTVRTLALVSVLAALAIGGYLFLRSSEESGPTSQTAERAEAQAANGVAATNFQAVAPILEQQRAETGTYAGAVIQPGYGVALVRADAVSYCLQAGSGAATQHVAGPNGAPAPGPC